MTETDTPTKELLSEISRRKTFAIISHPDAGKTTLTEKLLLYGGAVHLAGSVKARRAARHATSDWMEMEKERGISVTSSVLQFEYEDFQINLLDTPGHQDFSEDTYRTLTAADSVVMLLDNRKGVEEQTRKLFEVCKLRRTPIFTFVNKCDRPGESPLKLMDDVEADLGVRCYPVTWPIVNGATFLGVYHRPTGRVHLFDKAQDHGQSQAATASFDLRNPEAEAQLGESLLRELNEEIELLEVAGSGFNVEEFIAGLVTPVFFGSALTNFGVEPFLKEFLELAPSPQPRLSSSGEVGPTDPGFSGFVFKVQANMDPKHRDRIAFLRICSGHFETGRQVKNSRTGKDVRLTAPQQMFAQERRAVETAWPGDVVGIHDRGSLRIGDTLSDSGHLAFEDIPRFSPEHFARIFVGDPLRRKHLDTGLVQLSEEGAAQVFYAESIAGPAPIVGAVGVLQFDVLLHRLASEYGVEAKLERLPFTHARWVDGPEGVIREASSGFERTLVHDSKGQPLILFKSEWALRKAVEREIELTWRAVG